MLFAEPYRTIVARSDGSNGGWLLNSARATVAGPCLASWPGPRPRSAAHPWSNAESP